MAVKRNKAKKSTTLTAKSVVTWRKNGGGTFRLRNGRIIKPNEKFKAAIDEIPAAFRDLIKPVNDLDLVKAEKPEPKKPSYKLVEAGPEEQDDEDNPLFDIVDEDGKQVNEDALTEAEAKETLKKLME